ncbi:hypothetical protein CQW23_28719 [Capsicum baccatum]|uniref:Retrovirus-related Pol polyprotein from transposon TNT 1-94 n=1 Tax=Capsicum baccatum TaxID=33114 RepID=A0A2G2VHD3_CAPBA|nr:hypothetical protein CQW23_28719 [Capsicum baccatum]
MTNDSQVHDVPTNVEATSVATMSRTNASLAMATAEKPKKFAGIDFKRWQQKIFFYLTTFCLQRFIFEKAPEVPEGTSRQEKFVIVEAWKHSDLLYRNNILSDKVGEEAKWLQNFLEDIPYWLKLVAPVCIHCDSQAAIGRAGSMMYNDKSCHIRRRYNTVREILSSGIIIVDYVKSKDNVSNPLTKGLSREGVERTSKGIGLRPRKSQHGSNST